MSLADLERLRFAYSPLAEVTESLYMLASGRIQPVHCTWFDMTRERLRRVDTALLRAVVPAHPNMADFLFAGATDPDTTIEDQLQVVASYPPDLMHAELEAVWRGQRLPSVLQELVVDGSSGARRLADILWKYWTVAIEPHWRNMRAVLDGDVAYRAAHVTRGGIEALLPDLHPEISLHGHALRIDKPRHSTDRDLSGVGLLLVPSVFAWPNLVVGTGSNGLDPPSLTYGARGIGTLWETDTRKTVADDTLGALLGRSRATILTCVALPKSTTELALELGQSPPAVSAHLSILRRSGLVTSWRSGRRVLYQQTPLAASIVAASGAVLEAGSVNLA